MLILKLADNAYAFAIWLAGGIYKIAAYAFEVFIILSSGQIVSSDTYEALIQNFYILLGIILLFFLAFSLLKAMVNTEDQKQGTTAIKNAIINLVTSVALMAVLPTIFGFLYDFQTSFITRYNVIGRFFNYGVISDDSYVVDAGTKTLVEQGAYQISNGIFTAFMNVNMDKCESKDLEECQKATKNKEGIFRSAGDLSFWSAMQKVNSTGEFRTYNEFSANVTDGEVDFQWFLSIIAGLLLVYVAVSFCFDMGIRMIKLVFYQVIAPIPIFGRVVPEGPLKDSFGKWVKLVLTCYFEVYVRIFVFYFAVWLCLALMDAPLLADMSEFNFMIKLLTKAFLYMGIFMFMKQLPKLLSDVTGLDAGGMKLGIGEKLKDGGLFTAGAAIGGAATAGIRNYINRRNAGVGIGRSLGSAIGGTLGGAVRGGRAGWGAGSFSDMRNAASTGAQGVINARNRRDAYRAAHGGTALGVAQGRVTDAIDRMNAFVHGNELAAMNQRITTVQSFDIRDRARSWVLDNDDAAKDADARLKEYEQGRLNRDQILSGRMQELRATMQATGSRSAAYRTAQAQLAALERHDVAAETATVNAYNQSYFAEHERLRLARNAARDAAINRYATIEGSEIRQMIEDANRVYDQNSTDELFTPTRRIDFANAAGDLNDNHDFIVGHDDYTRDIYGEVVASNHDITGSIETFRGSENYRRAVRNQRIQQENNNNGH